MSASSSLHVIDTSQADDLRLAGSLHGIGGGEQLRATRFAGDRAYLVTYRQTDPLWIVDLRDSDASRAVGELEVPGWSDFLFPRGDTLLALGRGDRGAGVGVSLFDVGDPRRPRLVQQMTLGAGDARRGPGRAFSRCGVTRGVLVTGGGAATN